MPVHPARLKAQARPATPVRALLSIALGLACLLAGAPALAAANPQRQAVGGANTVGSEQPDGSARRTKLADFQQHTASADVQHIAHWAMDSGDAGGKPYIIIDKVNARVFVFDANGKVQGVDAALLGMARGDKSAEGIGDLRLSAIRPQDRVTPAGRFVASLDRDLKGQEILWIDYDDAIALHRVVKGQPSERRAQRLQSDAADDKRITYGCINVQAPFYESVVSPVFRGTGGVVYILPETGRAIDLFKSYDVAGKANNHGL